MAKKLEILYEDNDVVAVNKPAGLAAIPGRAETTSLLQELAAQVKLPCTGEADPRLRVVHRLDKDTSGCLILGRHPKAIARLNEMFKKAEIDKVYWAVVEGGPDADEGTIDLPLAPKSPDRGWWMKVDPKGQPSLTQWRVLGRSDGLTLLELRPITGRTHQLRVHCAASGFPILGDPIYGTAPRFNGPGLHLHARSVTVPLYPKKPPIAVEAPVPAHMRERVKACGIIPDGVADPGSSAG